MSSWVKRMICHSFIILVFGLCLTGTVRAEAAVKVKKVTVKSNYGKIVHVAVGKKVKLTTTVTVTPNKAANRKVKYTTSNKKIATVTSAGYVKGVSLGTCKVKAVSALNSKKKKSISVKVVQPVTNIEMEDTSGRMYVGETKILKKTVTPSSGSFKSVLWSSSNKKIATVSESGKIKGIAAGSVTIKASSVEGSGKTAKYSLKVQTPDTINLESAEVLAEHEVRVRLDKAAELTAENFNVQGKKYQDGKFIRTYEVIKVRNYDNKTYDLTLSDNYSIADNSFVRVRVESLPGNGTKSVTAQAVYIKTGTPRNVNWVYEVGDEIHEVIDLSAYGTGDISYNVTGSIEGIEGKCVENAIVFSGKMTEALVGSDFLIDAVDEMGKTITTVVHVYAGSEDTVVAAAIDGITLLTGVEQDHIPFAMAKGGSGQYTFVASGLPIAVTMNEDGTLSGAAVGSGEYEILVTVIDEEDNRRVANVSTILRVSDPRKIIGSVTDGKGNAVSGAVITCTNVNDDTVFETVSDEKGTYSLLVEEGAYNIRVVYLDYEDRVYNLTVSVGGRQLDFGIAGN